MSKEAANKELVSFWVRIAGSLAIVIIIGAQVSTRLKSDKLEARDQIVEQKVDDVSDESRAADAKQDIEIALLKEAHKQTQKDMGLMRKGMDLVQQDVRSIVTAQQAHTDKIMEKIDSLMEK